MDNDDKVTRDAEREPYARRMKLPIIGTGSLRARTYVRLLSAADAALLLRAWAVAFTRAKTHFRRDVAARHIMTILGLHPDLRESLDRETMDATVRTLLPEVP